jgi:hypothetical protein
MFMNTYYEQNRDKVLAYQRKRRAEMPAEKKARLSEQKRADNWQRRYGLTPEQVWAMEKAQNGCCAICANKVAQYHIDHCHTTGKVRGLLCVNCNRGLGAFRDNVQNMEKALEYLQACL